MAERFYGDDQEEFWKEDPPEPLEGVEVAWDEPAEEAFPAEPQGAVAGMEVQAVLPGDLHPAFLAGVSSPVRDPAALFPPWSPPILARVEGQPLLPLDGAKRLAFWAAGSQAPLEAVVVPMALSEWAVFHVGKALLRGPLEAHRARAFVEEALGLSWEEVVRGLLEGGWSMEFLASRFPPPREAAPSPPFWREASQLFRRLGRAAKALGEEDLRWLLEQLQALWQALEQRRGG